MNDKNKELLRIVDIVVECCAMEVDSGRQSVTRDDVLGKSRVENVVMTRCILCQQIANAGYSVTTIAQLLHRTPPAVRHMIELSNNYHRTSRAFRIAEAEATLRCKSEGLGF